MKPRISKFQVSAFGLLGLKASLIERNSVLFVAELGDRMKKAEAHAGMLYPVPGGSNDSKIFVRGFFRVLSIVHIVGTFEEQVLVTGHSGC